MLETTGAAGGDKLFEGGDPVGDIRFTEGDEAEEGVVDLLGVAG